MNETHLTAAEIVGVALGWVGTPYHHQASLRGVGTDCLGLVRGVWRELYGFDVEMPPRYSRDWAEAETRETMLEAARRHLVERPVSARYPGDVVIFRFKAGAVAKHAGILVGPDIMVHAQEGAVAAVVPLAPWWQRRISGVFAFPGVEI